MAQHNEKGKDGEEAAAAYLESKGYVIKYRNWRHNHLELDIVAVKDNELTIVEVKTRTNEQYGNPAEAVNHRKRRNILKATNAYLRINDLCVVVHFDIIAVIGNAGNFQIEHIQDAFSSFCY